MRSTCFITLIFALILYAANATATPFTLSTTTDSLVSIQTDSINFTESTDYAALYASDSAWLVPEDAGSLSFDYGLTLGQSDIDDYLSFEIGFNEIALFTASSGSFSLDLSSYAGQTIDIAWGLIWDFDTFAGTTASIFNIEYHASEGTGELNPVPEPATLVLLSAGLAGLVAYRKRKN